jgi:hypothetical protein
VPLIEYIPTYSYFSAFHEWHDEHSILDFGSNCGNLIKSAQGKILQKNYTAIDVDAEAIDVGRAQHPDANWFWYNRHNPVYNPSYSKELPDLKGRFDGIFSYSVFSHTTWPDTCELVDYLWNLLVPGGRMYLTMCDAASLMCVQWFRNRRVNCDKLPHTDSVVYLINNKSSTTPPDTACSHLVTFYNTGWLEQQWSQNYQIEIFKPPPGWLQSCAVFTKPAHYKE